MLLTVEGLYAGYGLTQVLSDVSFTVDDGSVVAVLGPNGAGKSTLLRVISGMRHPSAGRVVVEGEDLTGCTPARLVESGVVHCPEGRRMFPYMSAEANVRVGGYTRSDRQALERDVDEFFTKWEAVSQRRSTAAGQLSGGQQQLIALGRALMAQPRLLLLDEPSLGLAPVAVQQMYAGLRELAGTGQSILLVEQNARHALALADHVLVLVGGEIVYSGPTSEISAEAVARLYFRTDSEDAGS